MELREANRPLQLGVAADVDRDVVPQPSPRLFVFGEQLVDAVNDDLCEQLPTGVLDVRPRCIPGRRQR